MDENGRLLLGKKAVFLDLDGVVYAGDALLPGAQRTVELLRGTGIHVRFLSNNSLRHPRSISTKLARLGVPCEVEDVLTSGMLACRALEGLLSKDSEVLVLGTEELKAVARESGLRPTIDENAPAVLVGMDPEFRYEHIVLGSRAVKSGATFFACNRDGMFMGEGRRPFPGCGAMVGAIEGATGVPPLKCFGKPDPTMLQEAMASGGWGVGDCLMIGDTWSSDIEMARSAGMDWIYVSHDETFVPSIPGQVVENLGMLSVCLEGHGLDR